MTLPEPRADWALFLDFDGSLVEIAPTPESIHVPASLPSLLVALRRALGGAVAIVTGRPIEQIDGFLGPVVPAVAGLHGIERRKADGRVVRPPLPPDALRDVGRGCGNSPPVIRASWSKTRNTPSPCITGSLRHRKTPAGTR